MDDLSFLSPLIVASRLRANAFTSYIMAFTVKLFFRKI
jgi:hypothetical protein